MTEEYITAAQLQPESMTIGDALTIQASFLAALRQHQTIEIDLSQVVAFDCAGLQILLALKMNAVKQQKEVIFSGHSEQVGAFLRRFNINVFGKV